MLFHSSVMLKNIGPLPLENTLQNPMEHLFTKFGHSLSMLMYCFVLCFDQLRTTVVWLVARGIIAVTLLLTVM